MKENRAIIQLRKNWFGDLEVTIPYYRSLHVASDYYHIVSPEHNGASIGVTCFEGREIIYAEGYNPFKYMMKNVTENSVEIEKIHIKSKSVVQTYKMFVGKKYLLALDIETAKRGFIKKVK